jgi:hypothetical protein
VLVDAIGNNKNFRSYLAQMKKRCGRIDLDRYHQHEALVSCPFVLYYLLPNLINDDGQCRGIRGRLTWLRIARPSSSAVLAWRGSSDHRWGRHVYHFDRTRRER